MHYFRLTLLKDGLNYNYYDEIRFFFTLKPAIIECLKSQIGFGAEKNIVICLGRKNSKYLNEINKEYHFFNNIIVLDHPRYIMQYKLKSLDKYLKNI